MFKRFGLLFFLLILVFVSACSADNQGSEVREKKMEKAEKVEVVYFYATQRCFACIAMGDLSKMTVFEFFQPQLRDGEIEFKEVNVDLYENRELVQKFQARGSGLYINVIYKDRNVITEDVQVWRLISQESQFKTYLKDKINNLLGV